MKLIADIEVHGPDKLPDGNLIGAANHLGRLDTAAMLCVIDREDLIMPVAEKYKNHLVFGAIGRAAKAIWLNRFEADFSALREILARMEKGGLLFIALEGTRSKTEAMQEAKLGVAFLAGKSGYPVIPVAVTGTEDRVVLENLKHFRRSKIVVRVGEAFKIEIPKGKGREQVEDLEWRKATVQERLTHALVKGISNWVVEDTEEARLKFERPIQVIEGPLMDRTAPIRAIPATRPNSRPVLSVRMRELELTTGLGWLYTGRLVGSSARGLHGSAASRMFNGRHAAAIRVFCPAPGGEMTMTHKLTLILGLGSLFLPVLLSPPLPLAAARPKKGAADQCVACHRATSAGLVGQWSKSRHAKNGVSCLDCHEAQAGDIDGFAHYNARIATLVTPKDCGRCHETEAQEVGRSYHATAGQIPGVGGRIPGPRGGRPASSGGRLRELPRDNGKARSGLAQQAGPAELAQLGHRAGEPGREQGLVHGLPHPPLV